MFLRVHYNVRDTESKKIFNYKVLAIIVLLCAAFLCIAIIEPEEKELQKVEVVLLENPEISHASSKSHIDHIHFKVKGFEKFDTEFSYDKQNRDVVNNIVNSMQVMDTLFIEVPKNFYEKKILKTQSLSFIDKHFKYDEMPVYYVYDKNNNELLTTNY